MFEFLRSHFFEGFKLSVEMRDIVVPTHKTDFGNAEIILNEHFAGKSHAYFI